ncbi:MAG: hypothetical protein NTW96_02810 [Planctomycetia bacterium]|nr:hypothetical protein [Planctomycetia bacterium]
MTPKQRIEAVYQGRTPDQVPFMLDLSHWFYHKNRLPWDLSKAYDKPEYELIDYHKRAGVGFYVPNLGSFFEVRYPPDVATTVTKSDDGRTITWQHETPLGTIRRSRVWKTRPTPGASLDGPCGASRNCECSATPWPVGLTRPAPIAIRPGPTPSATAAWSTSASATAGWANC